MGPLLRGPANQKPTALLLCRHAVCTRTCSAPVGPQRSAPGIPRGEIAMEDASAIHLQNPDAFPELLPEFHSAISELPTIFTPSPAAQHTSRIFRSKGTNPTSPVQPMALLRAPNSLWRKPLPLTFALCSPTQFYIVLPEWLFGFCQKRLCYTLLRASQSLHDFCRPPVSPDTFFLLPQSYQSSGDRVAI